MKTQDTRILIPTTDGLHLSARVEGRKSGPTVVLVHGWPDNLHVWDAVVERLKKDFRIVRYDVRGAGQSEAPKNFLGYKLAQLAADFRRVIDHTSPDAPVHLVGHDWGSIQAWEFATEPALAERIASFTTISGPCLDHMGVQLKARGFSSANFKQLRASWYVGLFQIPFLGPLPFKLGLAERWPQVLARMEREPKLANHVQATQRRDAINGIGLYRANMPVRLLRPRQRPALVPVQLLVAERDPAVRKALFDGLERWVPDLTRHSIARAHWLPLTEPDWVAQHIASFVRARSPAKRGR